MAAVEEQAFDPRRPDFEPYGLSCVYWRATRMPRPDHHNELELNCMLAGAVTYVLGGRRVTARAGGLYAFWAAWPHRIIDFEAGTVYLVATIPLGEILRWRLPERFVKALLDGEFLCDPARTDPTLDRLLFERWRADLAGGRAELEATVLLEMQARITRFALAYEQHEAGRHTAPVDDLLLNKAERMALFIASHYTEPIGVEDIARHVGLAPTYAMTLFRKCFGTTLHRQLTRHRPVHAQRMLATTEVPITEIAMSAGFRSLSRFNEAFHHHFGCAPRDYRKHHDVTGR